MQKRDSQPRQRWLRERSTGPGRSLHGEWHHQRFPASGPRRQEAAGAPSPAAQIPPRHRWQRLDFYTLISLVCLRESALIWFDGEESEVRTLEPNDHERSQQWQEQPSPASPALCNPWAKERLGNISFSNYITFAQLCPLKNKNTTICRRPVSRPHSHCQPTARTLRPLAGFFEGGGNKNQNLYLKYVCIS